MLHHRRFRLILSLLALASLVLAGLVAAKSGDIEPKIRRGPLSAEDEALVKQFADLWNTREEGLYRNRFLGIHTLQHPFDVWITQEIFYQVEPEVVIEAGTYHGGSAILWAMYLQQITPGGRVVTIDIEDQREPKAIANPLARSNVDFLLGSSTDPEIVADVKRRAKGKRALVILDSLHTADHVYAELNAYAPVVPVGSYIIVQDTGVGPIHGIERFLAERDDFAVDASRERLLLTLNHRGYLKRIKAER